MSVRSRSGRQGDQPRSGGDAELLSERLVDDVHDGVLKTLLGKVAEHWQSTVHTKHLVNSP